VVKTAFEVITEVRFWKYQKYCELFNIVKNIMIFLIFSKILWHFRKFCDIFEPFSLRTTRLTWSHSRQWQ